MNTSLSDESVAHLFHSPPASLNQSGILPDIKLTNAAFVINDADYVTVQDTPPQTVEALFAVVLQMKEDYNFQLKKRVDYRYV